jgi:uncharacterized protein (DUF433 family)
MTHTGQFTAAEAAFILCEPIRAVKKAMDAGPVQPVLLSRAGSAVRAIGWNDLFYLYAVRALREQLTPKARGEFYAALGRTPIETGDEIRFGRFRISVTDLIEEVDLRTTELAKLAKEVEFRSDGEPVLKSSEVEVYRIAALLDGGVSIEEVLEDYPSLSRNDIETAKAYAEAYPKVGRPYPSASVKRALQGAGLEALDDI